MRSVAVLALIGCAHHAAPDDGAELYARASVLAGAGDREGAIGLLSRLAGCWTLPPREQDFPGLAGDPRFRALVDRIGAREPRIHRASIAMTLHVPALIPEGIAWDEAGQRLFVGSLYRREIVAIAPDGGVRTFAGAASGLDAVVGIRVDAERNVLWAATDGTRSMADARPGDAGRAAVMSFDLASGAVRDRVALPAPGAHFLNDLVVHRGEVCVTDTEAGVVWRLAEGRLAPLAAGFQHPNGIASDGDQLFVADDVAISAVRDGHAVRLPHPACAPTGGVDGLYYHRGALYAIQNGIGNPRVVRMQLDAGHRAIVAIDILETANPAFHDPTTGAIAASQHRLFVLADSWLDALDERDHQAPPHGDTAILAIPIDGAR